MLRWCLVALFLGACADPRVLAVVDGAQCDADRAVALADGTGSGLEGLFERERGWSLLFSEDRVLKLAEIGFDGSIEAGPFGLGSRNDRRGPVAFREAEAYRLVFGDRQDGLTRVMTGTLSDAAPEEGLGELERSVETDNDVSSFRVARVTGGPWVIVWRDGREIFGSPLEAGRADRPQLVEMPAESPPSVRDLVADSTDLWLLTSSDGVYAVDRLSWTGAWIEQVVDAVPATHAALAVVDDRVWLATATDARVEARALDGPEQVGFDAEASVTDLAADGGTGLVVAYSDATRWHVYFGEDDNIRSFDTAAVGRLEVSSFGAGAMVALEYGDVENVAAHRVCR